MTTAEPQHARPNPFRDGWWDFRRWRRARPFWGGLLTALAGLEIFGTTQMSLSGLAFQMGPTGFLSWLVPAILVTCGLLMWFSPQQRVFYAVVAAVTALFSLIGVNLGGFFVGLVLGTVGSGLGFAWVPDVDATARSDSESADEGTVRDDAAEDQTMGDDSADDQTMRGGSGEDQRVRGDPDSAQLTTEGDQTVHGDPTLGGGRGPAQGTGHEAPIANSRPSSTT